MNTVFDDVTIFQVNRISEKPCVLHKMFCKLDVRRSGNSIVTLALLIIRLCREKESNAADLPRRRRERPVTDDVVLVFDNAAAAAADDDWLSVDTVCDAGLVLDAALVDASC